MDIRNQFKEFLQKVTTISSGQFDQSILYFKELEIKKGAYFVKQGRICQQLAFIGSGILRIYYLNKKGEDTTSCFCIPNSFSTSYKSFILQEPSDLSIQALEDTRMLVISYSDLQKLYSESIDWQQLGRLFAEKEYLTMEKYASILNNETAKEKYLRLLKEQPEIIQKAPVQYIASYLGITRRTLSRIRKEIQA